MISHPEADTSLLTKEGLLEEGKAFIRENLPGYTVTQEDQPKHQLKHIKANRKKLGQIAYNCQKAAERRIYKDEYLQKPVHFLELWHEKLMEKKEAKVQIKEISHNRKSLEKVHVHGIGRDNFSPLPVQN